MIKLTEQIEFNALYDICLSGITGNNTLLNKLNVAKDQINTLDDEYRNKAINGKLYELRSLKCSSTKKCNRLKIINALRMSKNKGFKRKTTTYNPIVFQGIRRLEFIKLYETYFVNKEKVNARAIYDRILASAKQKCPYCGGIGNPRNLDHYLPKAHFPTFSILPINLVPCCRDCNMDAKADAIIHAYEKQLLHPYMDAQHFFYEQWIHINFMSSILDKNTQFFYEVNPPDYWSDADKDRVLNHFEVCDLAVRFSKDAVDTFINITEQIKELRVKGANNDMIVDCILEPYLRNTNRSINHWEKVLVKGLKETFF